MFLVSLPANAQHAHHNMSRLKAVAHNFGSFSEISIPLFRIDSSPLYAVLTELLHLDNATKYLLDKMSKNYLTFFQSFCVTMGDVERWTLRRASCRVGIGLILLDYSMDEKIKRGFRSTDFTWNAARYPPSQIPTDLCQTLAQTYAHFRLQVKDYDRTCIGTETCIRQTYPLLKKRPLYRKDLSMLNNPGSQYGPDHIMQVVYVVVERERAEDWLAVYESLHPCVAKGSSRLIAEDDIDKLYSVDIVREFLYEFRTACDSNGFLFRRHSSGQSEKDLDEECEDLIASTQSEHLCRMQKKASEILDLYLHIKVYRAFIAGLLKYGIQYCQMFLFHPRRLSFQEKIEKELKMLHFEWLLHVRYIAVGKKPKEIPQYSNWESILQHLNPEEKPTDTDLRNYFSGLNLKDIDAGLKTLFEDINSPQDHEKKKPYLYYEIPFTFPGSLSD